MLKYNTRKFDRIIFHIHRRTQRFYLCTAQGNGTQGRSIHGITGIERHPSQIFIAPQTAQTLRTEEKTKQRNGGVWTLIVRCIVRTVGAMRKYLKFS